MEQETNVVYDGTENSSNDTINWDDEVENLSRGGDGGDFPNSWYVRIQPNSRPTLKFLNDGRVGEMEDGTKKVFFDVEVAKGEVDAFDSEEEVNHVVGTDTDHPLTYSVNKGVTESSQFGQLAKVAAARGGLEGEEVQIMRRGEGTDTVYIVMEDEVMEDEVEE